MRWLDGITDSMDMSLSKLGVGGEQRSLVCCNSWDRKELDSTEWLNEMVGWHHSLDGHGSGWTAGVAGRHRLSEQAWLSRVAAALHTLMSWCR